MCLTGFPLIAQQVGTNWLTCSCKKRWAPAGLPAVERKATILRAEGRKVGTKWLTCINKKLDYLQCQHSAYLN
jgi:hypothetical protein